MDKKGNRSIQQKFKVTEEEAQKIKEMAQRRSMSVSEYIRQCTLNEDTIIVIDKADEILPHLCEISSLANDISQLVDEKDNTVELMKEEVQTLWQFLR